MKWKQGIVVVTVGLGAMLAACTGEPTRGAEPVTPVAGVTTDATPADRRLAVSLTEWTVAPSRQSIPAGALTIAATNLGQTAHDLVIVRSDAGPKDLPIVDGRGDETKMKVIGRFQEFKSGEKEKLFALDSGRYLLICNLPAHYQQGMVALLVVE